MKVRSWIYIWRDRKEHWGNPQYKQVYVERDGQTVEMKWEERRGWIQHRISNSDGDTNEQHKGDAKKNCYEGGTDIALLTVYKDETINSKTWTICDATLSVGEYFRTFRRTVLPSMSGSRHILLELFKNGEDVITIPWNVEDYSTRFTGSHPTELQCTATLLLQTRMQLV
jgi:hypothetical protein